jgi:ParB family transcriptional regulator, chromosome partitioning protein
LGKNLKEKKQSQPQKKRKLALGRGLDALIPITESGQGDGAGFFECEIDQIRPNPYQPRTHFSEAELAKLAGSIKEQGIIQPLLVRSAETGYELIAGERRLRAAKIAGLQKVPVVLKDVSDTDSLEISIIENIQREDLNPLEEAEAYQRLITEFKLTQEQAAVRVGKSRSAVANFLRLRQLSHPIKTSIQDGTLTMGHARALLGAENPALQNAAWREIVSKGLSVRQTESLIKKLKQIKKGAKDKIRSSEDRYFSDLADELSRQFGTRIQIKRRGKRGRVEIEFYSDEDLDRLISRLNRIA